MILKHFFLCLAIQSVISSSDPAENIRIHADIKQCNDPPSCREQTGVETWYFDPQTGECKKYVKKPCHSSENIFNSEYCKSHCEKNGAAAGAGSRAPIGTARSSFPGDSPHKTSGKHKQGLHSHGHKPGNGHARGRPDRHHTPVIDPIPTRRLDHPHPGYKPDNGHPTESSIDLHTPIVFSQNGPGHKIILPKLNITRRHNHSMHAVGNSEINTMGTTTKTERPVMGKRIKSGVSKKEDLDDFY